MFWFEDVYQNKDLVGTPLASMTINGKPIKIEKGDEVTVRFVSPDPYFALPTVLAAVLEPRPPCPVRARQPGAATRRPTT